MPALHFIDPKGGAIDIDLTDEQYAHAILHRESFETFHKQYQAEIHKIRAHYDKQMNTLINGPVPLNPILDELLKDIGDTSTLLKQMNDEMLHYFHRFVDAKLTGSQAIRKDQTFPLKELQLISIECCHQKLDRLHKRIEAFEKAAENPPLNTDECLH
jgi:hypothetical protein